jgi:hypothetical protein
LIWILIIWILLIWMYWFWIFIDPTDQDFLCIENFTFFIMLILNWMKVHNNSKSGILIFHLIIPITGTENLWKIRKFNTSRSKIQIHTAHLMWFSCAIKVKVFRFSERPILNLEKKIVKVHIFWEGHKSLWNLPLTFDYSTYSQK